MRALEFITGHVIYNLSYTYKLQLKTTLELSLNGTMLPMWGWLWSWKISFTSLKRISCLKMRFNLEKLGFWMCQDVKNTMFPWRHDKQFCINFKTFWEGHKIWKNLPPVLIFTALRRNQSRFEFRSIQTSTVLLFDYLYPIKCF